MAESLWYYAVAGTQYGPISEPELRQFIASRRVGAHDLVWREGMPEWQPAARIPSLFSVAQPVGPPAPVYSGAPVGYAPAAPAYASAPVAYVNPGGKSYNGFAIAGFVMSLIPAVTIIGLIFCLIALHGMKSSGNREGKGLATAGLTISLVYLGIGCLYFGVFFLFCGVSAFH